MIAENKPYFSVVIPLYNKERHILDAIRSILNQSYCNFEIIIVNDGSSDNSLKKLNDISDSRIRVLSQKNAGVSAARNKGIINSKFEYIAFLDADDEWEPHFLEEIYKLINKFPKNGWYATGYALKKNNDIKSLVPNELKKKKHLVDFFQYSLFDLLIHIDSTVIRKDSLENVGSFPIGVTHGEDQDLFARLALRYPLAYSGKIGTHYALDTDNRACDNVKVAELWPFLRNHEKLIQNLEISDTKRGYINKYVLVRITSRARALKNNGKTRESLKLMMKYKKTIFFDKIWIKNFVICLLPDKTFKTFKNKLSKIKL